MRSFLSIGVQRCPPVRRGSWSAPRRSGIGPVALRSLPDLEASLFFSGFDEVAMVGKMIGERRRHLRITNGWGLFSEAEVVRHDDGGALAKAADQMEQELSSSLEERQVAQLSRIMSEACPWRGTSGVVMVRDRGGSRCRARMFTESAILLNCPRRSRTRNRAPARFPRPRRRRPCRTWPPAG